MKDPKLARDWPGTRVKTLTPLTNAYMGIPAGTVCTVTEKYGAFKLTSDPCPKCGAKMFISRVPRRCFELIQKEI